MNLMKIAHVPPVTVTLKATVLDAVKAMVDNSVGAVAVVQDGVLQGIFSERDVMTKVIASGHHPEQTPVSDVMTREVEAIDQEMPATEALKLMVGRHFRHLPIVDKSGRVLGVLSIRNLLQNLVEELEDSVNSLASYFSADGPGG